MKIAGPRPYVGQPQNYELGTDKELDLWHDNSDPDQSPSRRGPTDSLNPERPPGSHQVKGPEKKKRMKWFRTYDNRK